MTPNEKFGLVLLLLTIAMRFDYSEEAMNKWGAFRAILEIFRIGINLACWLGACVYFIIPVIIEAIK